MGIIWTLLLGAIFVYLGTGTNKEIEIYYEEDLLI
jgi:hypothetical protein